MVIKERIGRHCIVRDTSYSTSLEHMLNLFAIVKKDFPNISPANTKIVQYAGRQYRGTRGLEFENPDGTTIPDDYKAKAEAELIM